MRRAGGQATVELVALLGLLVLGGLALLQALVAGAARELAPHAAEAGAIALAQGRDARSAARAALPGWLARDIAVTVGGRRVTVLLRPRSPIPELAALLAARASADAGP